MLVGLVSFSISTIVAYLMINLFQIYLFKMQDLVLWYINHCRFFDAKCTSNIYDLVGFYGISAIVSYLMQNPFYKYVLNI